jgi:hypothetical protein
MHLSDREATLKHARNGRVPAAAAESKQGRQPVTHIGGLCTPDPVDKGELAVFDQSDAGIEFEAVTDARFVLGTAIPHPHDLHLGYYSAHTSHVALIESEREITRIARELGAKRVVS